MEECLQISPTIPKHLAGCQKPWYPGEHPKSRFKRLDNRKKPSDHPRKSTQEVSFRPIVISLQEASPREGLSLPKALHFWVTSLQSLQPKKKRTLLDLPGIQRLPRSFSELYPVPKISIPSLGLKTGPYKL